MAAYTPGPWNWEWVSAPASGGGHLYLIDSTGRKIAALWGKADEKEANACLSAAAPDLLAAVDAQHDAIDWLLARVASLDREFRPSESPAWKAVEQGFRAMQKARGEGG